MMSAFKRFFAFGTALAMCAFVAWGYLRVNGENRVSKVPLSSEFLTAVPAKTTDLVIYRPFGEATADYYTADRLKILEQRPAAEALWIDIHPRVDGSLIAGLRDEDTSASLSLAEVLKATGDRRLILNLSGYRPGLLERFAKILTDAKAVARVLIQSPEDGFLKDARTDQPTWLFGTSQTQLTLMIMLSSIGLQSQAPFHGDVFVMEGEPSERPLIRLSDEMIAEVHRRGRKIYAGPAVESEVPKLAQRGVDGVLLQLRDLQK